jgi:hypothetical protein
MPLRQSICWRPVADSYHLLAAVLGSRRSHYPLFVTQTALRELAIQHAAPDDSPFLGVLGGVIRESLEREIPYVTITRAVSVAPFVKGKTGKRALRTARDAAAEHLAELGEEVLGWYRRRRELKRGLLPGDQRVTLELFPEPWQCALIVAPDGSSALYRYKPEGERSYMAPFYEMLDEPGLVDGSAASLIDWSAYERADRAEYPEITAVELEEQIRLERDSELGWSGMRLLEKLRRL